MLINKNYADKSKSKFICDRCKRKIGQANRYGIYVSSPPCSNIKKTWDLCRHCYMMLDAGIKKGVTKKNV